ncbi:MAG: hypothetical protein UR62_C0009G0009 [Candidatus Nomurabacteria bacterium GW2011_GWF2_35_12]|uniref:Uncharacterized protein n=3 Tax=Candidatus Nomuraibacteriota TaxID=1752729 RepID=A0A0G0EA34_9BACT|nr:MAG: hypothetical protein UR62_C0009G0009 [Candidatus Nomurabacteria bacterium GW2011_GWF2_35_12]KKP72791.1 MAG: hypothetical protein UR70_C0004G0034 [Candidatus Nomurabacteria bacterium GW2011_GWB1_35_20]KKP75522.1 MAG: hypothetical protein UR72_C0005G0039 [Parcubacteria group bacterium GW2011_GWC1_35_21]KKP78014.1 MAG: hypothetical protein UR77_C0008G0009 [Candidatus Nomurabacteria bacterium GW2011_GWC2_35_35]KKP85434.1 MAG: hypothetical protein UR86_C0003G0004 [Parcubacteria group bacteri
MSKRNLILLIMVLVVIVAGAFVFFYFYQPEEQTIDDTEGTNFFANFLPFGKSKTATPSDTTTPADISGFEPAPEEEMQNVSLKKVSSFPVAGYGTYMKERYKEVSGEEDNLTPPAKGDSGGLTEFVPMLRYVDKATGNIYQTFADKIDERKFSSSVIPRVYEAFFGNEGESVIMRYLKTDNRTIETFVGALPKEFLGSDSVGTNEIKGSFLPENISDISVSPDTSKIFYLFDVGDGALGITLVPQTNARVQVFDSPFTEWLSSWPNNKMITITTKPSANVLGYMYAIDPDKKDFNKILGGINGLTTLTSPNGRIVLYSNNNLSLSVFNRDTGNSNLLGVKTLPEKCVWGGSASDIIYCAVPRFIEQAQYPDSWYQGEISFSDEIWKIDVKSGNTTMIADPVLVENGEEIDGIKLNLDGGQNYLFFVNKKDSYLWELQLK